MADPKKISDLPNAAPLADADYLPIVQGLSTKKATFSQISAYVNARLPAVIDSSTTGSAASLTNSRTLSATGDATWSVAFNGSANVTAALTLATTGVAAGTYGQVTVDAKGRVTAAAAVTPVANGGTGRNTTALYLADLVTAGAYSKTSILGTVSQASGVPTGAVIERGSNTNGEYVKYADGTLICTKSVTSESVAVTGTYGPLFQGSAAAWTFPVPFLGALPVVNCDPYTASRLALQARNIAPSLTGANFAMIDIASGTYTYSIRYSAIGRWF